MRKLIDTQKLKELGSDGTSNLMGSWALTAYTNEECLQYRLEIYPANTAILKADSWPDFDLKFANDKCTLWSWKSSSGIYQIQHRSYGFGTAPSCGHTATIMVSNKNKAYYLCDRFRSNADMSDFTAIIEGLAEYPFTGDACLGKTCKFYQELKNSNSTL